MSLFNSRIFHSLVIIYDQHTGDAVRGSCYAQLEQIQELATVISSSFSSKVSTSFLFAVKGRVTYKIRFVLS